jgi:hypothetical protein
MAINELSIGKGRLFHQFTASAQRVPGRLDVVGNPLVDGLVVFRGVLDIFVDLAGVVDLPRAIKDVRSRGLHTEKNKRVPGTL